MGKVDRADSEVSRTCEPTTQKQRISWVDYAKGFAIILVLVAHGLSGENVINKWAYSFHLPLFFVISGLLLNSKTFTNTIGQIAKKYAHSLLLPYYIFGALNFLVEVCKDVIQKDFTIATTLDNIMSLLLWRGLKATWFLPCLFLAIILTFTIIKLINKKWGLLVTFVAAFVLCVFVPAPKGLVVGRLLLVFLRAVVASFFVAVGHCLRTYFFAEGKKYSAKKETSLCLILLVGNILLTCINGKVSLANWNFGANGFAYLLNGVVGSLFVLLLMRLLDKSELKLLRFCGQNSLTIMAIHMAIMAFFGAVLEKVLPQGVLSDTLIILLTFIFTIIATPVAKKLLPQKRSS